MALHDHSIQLTDRGMRILKFPLIRLLIAIAIFAIGSAMATLIAAQFYWIVGHESYASWVKPLVTMVFQSGFAILGYWLFVSLFDGRPMTELTRKWGKLGGLGLLLGFGFISVIMAILFLLGYYRMDGLNTQPALFGLFCMSLTAGFTEEILLRGYFFRIVEEGLGTWWSVVFSALLFGFLHAWNPNASLISSLSIALTAGVVLALLYAITRNLWIVIGMHFAWNFTLGGIYSAPVSGGAAEGILNSTMDGPEWLTGGAFGPEASVITMLVFSLFGIYLIYRTIRDKQVIKPMWRRSV